MKDTKIEWADHTFNPWHGCVKVSPACLNCYADTMDKRFGESHWGSTAPRRFFGAKHWREPLQWNMDASLDGVPRRVFCASMADVFEVLRDDHADSDTMDSARRLLWQVIETTPWLEWMLLTKRPENIMKLVPPEWGLRWPVNVWPGVTVEDQERAEERLVHLAEIPARVRFLSMEPLLGAVNLRCVRCRFRSGVRYVDALTGNVAVSAEECEGLPFMSPKLLRVVDWVICGGESGPRARPSDPDWFRMVRGQCVNARIPFFFKQWGEWGPGDPAGIVRIGKEKAGRLLDGRTWDEFPVVRQTRPVYDAGRQ